MIHEVTKTHRKMAGIHASRLSKAMAANKDKSSQSWNKKQICKQAKHNLIEEIQNEKHITPRHTLDETKERTT